VEASFIAGAKIPAERAAAHSLDADHRHCPRSRAQRAMATENADLLPLPDLQPETSPVPSGASAGSGSGTVQKNRMRLLLPGPGLFRHTVLQMLG